MGRMEGSPFGTIHLYNVRWHQHARPGPPTDAGTDLRVAHAELTFAWHVPLLQKPVPSAVQCLVLTGVSGRWDLATPTNGAKPPGPGIPSPGRWLDRLASRLVPTDFSVQSDDFSLQRNRFRLRLSGLRLSGERNGPGLVSAREVEISGPGFRNTLFNRHGQTVWQGDRISISELEFSPGIRLLSATLDGKHLQHQRLDWECTLTAMGGEIRGQGAINFVHPRLALEVAGSLRRMPVAPLARLVGLASPAGGLMEQANFSFRGDPEDWPSAQMWLAMRATDFRWGLRAWQNLELRATVLHQRIQVRRLELQQSLNRLSLTGECPLPSPGQLSGRWWEARFACNVDARLDDLHALAQLFGTRLPALAGRMSVNGRLEAVPGRPGINGYLNVEGSRLTIRDAPLDYLHSTLVFRGDELEVADVQATRGTDYFAGQGSVSLAGVFGYQGEFRLAVADPGLYATALAGIIDFDKAGLGANGLSAPLRAEGVFYGPNLAGNTSFLTFGNSGDLPGLAMPDGVDWLSGHWSGLTSWPDEEIPAAVK